MIMNGRIWAPYSKFPRFESIPMLNKANIKAQLTDKIKEIDFSKHKLDIGPYFDKNNVANNINLDENNINTNSNDVNFNTNFNKTNSNLYGNQLDENNKTNISYVGGTIGGINNSNYMGKKIPYSQKLINDYIGYNKSKNKNNKAYMKMINENKLKHKEIRGLEKGRLIPDRQEMSFSKTELNPRLKNYNYVNFKKEFASTTKNKNSTGKNVHFARMINTPHYNSDKDCTKYGTHIKHSNIGNGDNSELNMSRGDLNTSRSKKCYKSIPLHQSKKDENITKQISEYQNLIKELDTENREKEEIINDKKNGILDLENQLMTLRKSLEILLLNNNKSNYNRDIIRDPQKN